MSRISDVTGEIMKPVLYLDVDDTIRKGYTSLGRFVNTAEDVEVFPQVPELIARYKRAGWRVVTVSNQGGIALGHVTFIDVIKAMNETSRQCKNLFDKMTFCIHHPDADTPEMAQCWCRKPRAGLVFEAAMSLKELYPKEIYPPHLGLFVGDRREDQECAIAANLEFLQADLWRTGRHITAYETEKSRTTRYRAS